MKRNQRMAAAENNEHQHGIKSEISAAKPSAYNGKRGGKWPWHGIVAIISATSVAAVYMVLIFCACDAVCDLPCDGGAIFLVYSRLFRNYYGKQYACVHC